MHIAEQGKGPLVILCHGFPEFWYSWRHQLHALADAGFRAVAPDQRGFGQTDCLKNIEDYNIFQLTGDMVGLVHALGKEKAAIVGHDWGALVAWHCALLRPDIFHTVALLSVPFIPRVWTDVKPVEGMRQMAGEKEFYVLYFQEPGKAEKELEVDIRKTFRRLLYSASGDPPPEKRWNPFFEKSKRFIDSLIEPESLPAWLTEHDLEIYTKAFEHTGFRGGLDWYRNYDFRWQQTGFLCGAKLQQPTLFVAGEFDTVISMRRKAYENLEENVPNLWKKVLLPGAGHWIQQERPEEVSQLLIEFLTNNL